MDLDAHCLGRAGTHSAGRSNLGSGYRHTYYCRRPVHNLDLVDPVRNIVFKRFPGASRPRPTQEKSRAPDATETELEIASSCLLHPT